LFSEPAQPGAVSYRLPRLGACVQAQNRHDLNAGPPMAITISVVIPTYNRAALVPRAVASPVDNVTAADEIIVVDAGSTDGTAEALAPYRDRIRLLRGPHAGAGAARNFGIAAAQGDVIAFLDSDDEWMPNKLLLQRALFQARPDVLFC